MTRNHSTIDPQGIRPGVWLAAAASLGIILSITFTIPDNKPPLQQGSESVAGSDAPTPRKARVHWAGYENVEIEARGAGAVPRDENIPWAVIEHLIEDRHTWMEGRW